MSNNDITGDKLISKLANDAFREGWDKIFGERKTLVSISVSAAVEDEIPTLSIGALRKPQAS